MEKGCHEAKLFTYPSEKVAYHLFQKHGFKEVAFIDHRLFGVSIVLMVRKITPIPEEHRAKKIVLAGEAGQGIKLMAHALANILAKLGKEVALNLVYDATVRGGNIRAEIVYSDEPIEVPFLKKRTLDFNSQRRRILLFEPSMCLSSHPPVMLNVKSAISDVLQATAFPSKNLLLNSLIVLFLLI